MGRIEAIWVKRMKRGPMDPKQRVQLIAGKGIEGNANQGGRRQVTIIEKEIFGEIEAELMTDVDPRWRRANVMVSGLPLIDSRGKTLAIGDCRIQIFGETKPCEKLEEACRGLRAALEPRWGGGASGMVIVGGEICVGDPIDWA